MTVLNLCIKIGEMREWFNRLPWKGSNWATGSRVRIPLSPPIQPSIIHNPKNVMYPKLWRKNQLLKIDTSGTIKNF